MRPGTKTELARERGVHPSRVTQWKKDGRVIELPDGRVDLDDAHARLDASLDRSKGARRAGNITSISPEGHTSDQGIPVQASAPVSAPIELPLGVQSPGENDKTAGDGSKAAGDGDRQGGQGRDDTSYWAHKAKREEYEALLAQAKYFREAGALTSAAAVRKEAMDTARALRNALENIPDRVAPVLDPGNPARAHKLLLDEIRKALHEFSHRMGERTAAAAAGESDPALLQRLC